MSTLAICTLMIWDIQHHDFRLIIPRFVIEFESQVLRERDQQEEQDMHCWQKLIDTWNASLCIGYYVVTHEYKVSWISCAFKSLAVRSSSIPVKPPLAFINQSDDSTFWSFHQLANSWHTLLCPFDQSTQILKINLHPSNPFTHDSYSSICHSIDSCEDKYSSCFACKGVVPVHKVLSIKRIVLTDNSLIEGLTCNCFEYLVE